MTDQKTTTIAGGGAIDAEGEVKPSPFSVFITYKSETPSIEDMKVGGELAKEFFDLGNDEDSMPDCVESVTIKRSK